MNEEFTNEEEKTAEAVTEDTEEIVIPEEPREAEPETDSAEKEEAELQTEVFDAEDGAADGEGEETSAEEKPPKPKGRIIFSLFITLFCMLVAFLSVYGFIVPDREFSEKESRLLAKMPEVTLSGVLDGSFMKDFEGYLTDQFPFRDEAIYIKSLIERALGKNEENGAYIGKNGFLFEKQTPYDEEKMQGIAASVNRFVQSNKGINTVFALVPDSSFVYSEQLPDYLKEENQQEQIDKFYALLDEKIIRADTVTPLLEAKKEHQVFYKTDHHWTTRGAFSVFEVISASLGESADRDDFEFHTVSNSFEGTLSSKSPAHNAVDSVEVCFPKKSQGTYFAEFSGEGNKRESLFFKEKLEEKNHYEVFLGSNCAKISVTTVLEGDRRLLVIKDSFANCMIPMLTPYFSKIVVVDPRYMTEGIDGVMNEDEFTDILFLYNANTLFGDSVLTDVLALYNEKTEEIKNEQKEN